MQLKIITKLNLLFLALFRQDRYALIDTGSNETAVITDADGVIPNAVFTAS